MLLNITGLTLNVATELSFSDVNVSVTKQVFGWDQQLATCQVQDSGALTLLRLAVQPFAGFEGSSLASACSRLAFSVLPHCFDALLITYAVVTDAFAIWKTATQTVSLTKVLVVLNQAGTRDFFSFSKRWEMFWDALCLLFSVPVDFSRQVKHPGRETNSLPTASLPLTPLWHP